MRIVNFNRMLRDWIFMKARSRVEIDDALTVGQLIDKGLIKIYYGRVSRICM